MIYIVVQNVAKSLRAVAFVTSYSIVRKKFIVG